MFKRPRTRGTSVLAAVVLAGVLGGLILAIDAITPTDARSLAAQAAAPSANLVTPGPSTFPDSPAAKTSLNIDSPKNCDAAIAKALNKLSDGIAQGVDEGKAGTLDTCYGAISKIGKPSAKASDYQCVGREGSVTIAGGKATSLTAAAKDLDPTQCRMKICEGGKCSTAKRYDGGFNASTATLPDATKAFTFSSGAGTEPVPSVGGIGGSDQITGAFDPNVATNDVVGTPKSVATGCGSSSSWASCEQALQNAGVKVSSNPSPSDWKVPDAVASGCATGTSWSTCQQALQQTGVNATVADPSNFNNLNSGACPGNPGCPGNSTGDPVNNTPGSCPGNPGCPGNPTGFGGPEAPGDTTGKAGGDNSFLNQLAQSLLKGLSGALSGAMGGQQQSNAPTCSTDPTVYQQQQQQYNQQLQQYQQQMQQYQYQQQLQQYYGSDRPLPPAPVQPQQCKPGSSSTTGTTATQSNTATVQPTAQLSCQPQVADVGMSVAITYGCTNATGSVGNGFSTGSALSGATSTVIANPPAGATKMNFQLTCMNQSATARGECSVEIARPSIVLVANPKNVKSGEASTIGWITSAMQSCTVSSPQMPEFTSRNAGNTSVNGMATTSPLTAPVDIVLRCSTLAGGTRTATTTVSVIGVSSTVTLDVSASVEANQSVSRTSTATVQWQSTNAPSNAAVALWLYDHRSGVSSTLIARDRPLNGTFEWDMPDADDACPNDTPYACATDLVPGRTYSIEASIYTPADAYLGGYPPTNAVQPQFLKSDTTESFKMQD